MKNTFLFLLICASSHLFAQTSMLNNQGSQFNPALGLNAMMLTQKSEVDSENDGFGLQGVELQFNSDVDAYFRAQIVLGIHKEIHDHDEEEEAQEEEEAHSGEFKLHAEEVYVETISIPGVTIKAGKFLSQFGKYNAIHLHALPFIYRGIVQTEMFGYEGFSSPGLSSSFLIPLNWYSEFTLEAMAPENENLFERSSHATTYVAKIKNLWDFNDTATIEWGVSSLNYTRAAYNDHEEEKTQVMGTDFTFKWRPLKNGRSESFMFSTEYIQKKREGSVELENAGITSFIRYQFKPRWFMQAQYENLGINRSEDEEYAHGTSAMLAFIPSEFSAVRLQYDNIKSDHDEDEKRISLQLNISIGAHPAHMY